MIFEYKVVCTSEYTGKSQSDFLNEYGQDGWELVAVLADRSYTTFYFKRTLPQ